MYRVAGVKWAAALMVCSAAAAVGPGCSSSDDGSGRKPDANQAGEGGEGGTDGAPGRAGAGNSGGGRALRETRAKQAPSLSAWVARPVGPAVVDCPTLREPPEATAIPSPTAALNNTLLLPTRQAASGPTPEWVSVAEYAFADWATSSTLRHSVKVTGVGAQVSPFSATPDGAGGMLFGGAYYGTAQLNGSTNLPEKIDGSAPFVAKADSAGTVLWSRSLGAEASGRVSSLSAITHTHSSFVAGSAQGILDFGGGAVMPIGTTIVYDTSYFVTRMSSNGGTVWAARFAWPDGNPAIFVSAALDDTAYVAGSLKGSTDLGQGALTSAGGDDVFVAKYAP